MLCLHHNLPHILLLHYINYPSLFIPGAGRGYVSRHFLPDSVEKVTLCDSSQTHLNKAIIGDGVQFDKIVIDEENFDVSK